MGPPRVSKSKYSVMMVPRLVICTRCVQPGRVNIKDERADTYSWMIRRERLSDAPTSSSSISKRSSRIGGAGEGKVECGRVEGARGTVPDNWSRSQSTTALSRYRAWVGA